MSETLAATFVLTPTVLVNVRVVAYDSWTFRDAVPEPQLVTVSSLVRRSLSYQVQDELSGNSQ